MHSTECNCKFAKATKQGKQQKKRLKIIATWGNVSSTGSVAVSPVLCTPFPLFCSALLPPISPPFSQHFWIICYMRCISIKPPEVKSCHQRQQQQQHPQQPHSQQQPQQLTKVQHFCCCIFLGSFFPLLVRPPPSPLVVLARVTAVVVCLTFSSPLPYFHTLSQGIFMPTRILICNKYMFFLY